jgi:hypothetical protein
VSPYKAPITRRETAKGHYYRDADGARVTGVTTWIGDGIPKPALINWAGNTTAEYAVDHWDELAKLPPAARLKKLTGARYEAKDTAAKRGTEVHRIAELLVAGKAVEVPDDIAGHADAYARFLDEFRVQPVLVEFSCVSYRLGYAGTADLVARMTLTAGADPVLVLGDVKTSHSGIFGETALQLAAYRYADAWIVDGVEQDPMPVQHCVGIHVRADGYDLLPLDVDQAQHKAFWHAQRVAEWSRESRDLVGPPIQPPTASMFRLTREAS